VVGQRNHQIKPIEGATHDWWKVAEKAGHFKILKMHQEKHPGKQITIRSEVCGPGIQDNIYKLPCLTLITFDVMIDGKYLDVLDFYNFCMEYALEHAPILGIDVTLREWLEGKTIEVASNGPSKVGQTGTLREGIVIKPMIEQYDGVLGGRLFLKMRDPIYLDKTGK
jgi:hypothetical protein